MRSRSGPDSRPRYVAICAGVQRHARRSSPRNRTGTGSSRRPARTGRGRRAVRAARAIVTRPSSSGWRSTSSTRRSNSGISSRNSTPLCASEISPGRGMAPPPTSATFEIGVMRRAERPLRSAGRRPAAACRRRNGSPCTRAPRRTSAAAGSSEPPRHHRLAGAGRAVSSRLWPPAAATSSARRAKQLSAHVGEIAVVATSRRRARGAPTARASGASSGRFSASTASGSDCDRADLEALDDAGLGGVLRRQQQPLQAETPRGDGNRQHAADAVDRRRRARARRRRPCRRRRGASASPTSRAGRARSAGRTTIRPCARRPARG